MAISDDTAALVAAQLTQAWAEIYAQNPGAGGLMPADAKKIVADFYHQFLSVAKESA